MALVDTRTFGQFAAHTLTSHQQIRLQNDADVSLPSYGTDYNKARISCSNGAGYSDMISGYYNHGESRQKLTLHGDISFDAGAQISFGSAQVAGDQVATDLIAQGGGLHIKNTGGTSTHASISNSGAISAFSLTTGGAIEGYSLTALAGGLSVKNAANTNVFAVDAVMGNVTIANDVSAATATVAGALSADSAT